ncbi:hypothetical protein BGW39_002768 [Mortierella sp. 14UC]|nr:hypothetical protein BGW39_002768 [Mortierella sp. 14UC]
MRLLTLLGACALVALSTVRAQDIPAPDVAAAGENVAISAEGVKKRPEFDPSVYPSLELEQRVHSYNAYVDKKAASAEKKKAEPVATAETKEAKKVEPAEKKEEKDKKEEKVKKAEPAEKKKDDEAEKMVNKAKAKKVQEEKKQFKAAAVRHPSNKHPEKKKHEQHQHQAKHQEHHNDKKVQQQQHHRHVAKPDHSHHQGDKSQTQNCPPVEPFNPFPSDETPGRFLTITPTPDNSLGLPPGTDLSHIPFFGGILQDIQDGGEPIVPPSPENPLDLPPGFDPTLIPFFGPLLGEIQDGDTHPGLGVPPELTTPSVTPTPENPLGLPPNFDPSTIPFLGPLFGAFKPGGTTDPATNDDTTDPEDHDNEVFPVPSSVDRTPDNPLGLPPGFDLSQIPIFGPLLDAIHYSGKPNEDGGDGSTPPEFEQPAVTPTPENPLGLPPGFDLSHIPIFGPLLGGIQNGGKPNGDNSPAPETPTSEKLNNIPFVMPTSETPLGLPSGFDPSQIPFLGGILEETPKPENKNTPYVPPEIDPDHLPFGLGDLVPGAKPDPFFGAILGGADAQVDEDNYDNAFEDEDDEDDDEEASESRHNHHQRQEKHQHHKREQHQRRQQPQQQQEPVERYQFLRHH